MALTQQETVATLRDAIAGLEQGVSERSARLFRLGPPDLDASLGGGLLIGALHEVYARGAADAAAAAGFGLGLALGAAGGRALVWARQDVVDLEAGGLYGEGLAAFGLDPERLLLVRARDPTGTLRAVAEAARCPAVGAALVELWGEPKALDLKASRRLSLAASASGVTVVMIRLGASPAPSAATSRWEIAASASAPLEANAPGRPAFEAVLLRHRAGLATRAWRLEWDRDRASFAPAPLPRSVVPVPADGPAAAEAGEFWRRAG
jgi:protein ImuA